MASLGYITVEVKPTVTLESAASCLMMLNMFLADNEGYGIEYRADDDRWHLFDRTKEGGDDR